MIRPSTKETAITPLSLSMANWFNQKLKWTPTSPSSLKRRRRCKKQVRFNDDESNFIQEQSIEPLFEYTRDLWWSEEELEYCRLEQARHESETLSKTGVQAYMQIYNKAKAQVYVESRLSADILGDLTRALQQGYDGMERHSIAVKHSRQKRVQKLVNSVRSAYTASIQGKDPCRLVQKHSQAITQGDREWAAATAKAVAAAVASFYREDGIYNKYNNNNNYNTGRGIISYGIALFTLKPPLVSSTA